MENQFSKQDKAINEGATALREMSMDISKLSSVLNPRPRRSIVLPIGLATAAACALGAVLLIAPAKASASPFEKVKKAVLKQKTIHERVFQRGQGDVWELRIETYEDDRKRGVKWGKVEGGYQYVIADGKKIEKLPETFELRISTADQLDMGVADDRAAIHEILARDGMQFLGIQRSQKREGRVCDIYRVNFKDEPNDLLYYVDPKSDLPFLLEVVDRNGKVIDKIEIDFTATITIETDEVLKVEGTNLTHERARKEKDLFTVESDMELEVAGQKLKTKGSRFTFKPSNTTKKDK